jgi:hypothetical protein
MDLNLGMEYLVMHMEKKMDTPMRRNIMMKKSLMMIMILMAMKKIITIEP